MDSLLEAALLLSKDSMASCSAASAADPLPKADLVGPPAVPLLLSLGYGSLLLGFAPAAGNPFSWF